MKALPQASPLLQPTSLVHSFSKQDLELCADGLLFGIGNAQLPKSPLLLLDRIIDIQRSGGANGRGYAVAELDVEPSNWFFKHHFQGDPVMPGCFLIESMWQLTGFHLAWSGHEGRGRVLDSGRTRFLTPIENTQQTLTITVDIRKTVAGSNPICIANSEIRSGAEVVCRSETIKVGAIK